MSCGFERLKNTQRAPKYAASKYAAYTVFYTDELWPCTEVREYKKGDITAHIATEFSNTKA